MSRASRAWRCRRISSRTESNGEVQAALDIIAKQFQLIDELNAMLREASATLDSSMASLNRSLAINESTFKSLNYWKNLAESRAEVYELVEAKPVNAWIN
jgi:hypothetical protein